MLEAFNIFDAKVSDIDYFYASRFPGEPADGVEVLHNSPCPDRKWLILNGEMAEWSKAHAWKTTPATPTEQHRNTSSRSQFNDLPL